MMTPRGRWVAQGAVMLVVAIGLFVAFPHAFAFVESAALNVMRLWWLVLLLVLAIWLIWGFGRGA
jgi:hypothetical protein